MRLVFLSLARKKTRNEQDAGGIKTAGKLTRAGREACSTHIHWPFIILFLREAAACLFEAESAEKGQNKAKYVRCSRSRALFPPMTHVRTRFLQRLRRYFALFLFRRSRHFFLLRRRRRSVVRTFFQKCSQLARAAGIHSRENRFK